MSKASRESSSDALRGTKAKRRAVSSLTDRDIQDALLAPLLIKNGLIDSVSVGKEFEVRTLTWTADALNEEETAP